MRADQNVDTIAGPPALDQAVTDPTAQWLGPVPGADDGIDVEALRLLLRTELDRKWSEQRTALDTICRHAMLPAGKLFRPVLLLISAQAVGGEAAWVLPAAVGAECGHVASLIHDDIIDGDTMRRGRASVPYKYGTPDAIIAGDALIFHLFACLAECRETGVPDGRVTAAMAALADAGLALCKGQSLESELHRSRVFDLASYVTMIRLKTASSFRAACEIGAILGGGTPDEVSALTGYGDALGTAFQIHDDLLPYTSDSRTAGKAATSDIRNGRATLPVILAYRAGTDPDRELIDDCLAGATDPTLTLSRMAEILARTGAIAAAADVARQRARWARRALDVLPPTGSRDTLAHYADLAIERDH
ncbi:MAG: geranylgeranyl diphosphate synthase, type [Mycobacteriales bacterium]